MSHQPRGHVFERHAVDPARRFPPLRAYRICRVLKGTAALVEDEHGELSCDWTEDAKVEQVGLFQDPHGAEAALDNFAKAAPRYPDEAFAVFDPHGKTLAYKPAEKPTAKKSDIKPDTKQPAA